MSELATEYLHIVDGRIRVKIPTVKGSAVQAAHLEGRLGALPGIESVQANPVTGNVLVHYESSQITQHEILSSFLEWGLLRTAVAAPAADTSMSFSPKYGQKLAGMMVTSALETAVKSLVRSLL